MSSKDTQRHAADRTKYLPATDPRQRALGAVTIPEGRKSGGSYGFDLTKAGPVVVIDGRDSKRKPIVFDASQVPTGFNTAAKQAYESGDPILLYEAVEQNQHTGSQHTPSREVKMARPKKPAPAPAPDLLVKAANESSSSPDKGGQDIASVLTLVAERLGGLTADVAALKAERRRKKLRLARKAQSPDPGMLKIQPNKHNQLSDGDPVGGSSWIFGLVGKPKHAVIFDTEGMGRMQARFHDVIDGTGIVVLVYDTRFDAGTQYDPPDMGVDSPPTRLVLPDQKKSYQVRSLGLSAALGPFDLVIMVKEREESDS